ncbi:hypothetical protein ACS0TY_029294 [Phlomoides rotata]
MQPPVFPFETENSTALFVADGLPPLLAADGRPRLPLLQFVPQDLAVLQLQSISFTASIARFLLCGKIGGVDATE